MADVLILTNSPESSSEVLPALALLAHNLRALPAEPAALVNLPDADAIVVDGRSELMAARSLCRLLTANGLVDAAVLLVVTDSGWAAVSATWGIDDVLLDRANPAEVDARIRIGVERARAAQAAPTQRQPVSGGIRIDESAYSARVHDRVLDLTYKEFELLKYLSRHPGRVFSRAQLLQEVWGYDYFGGTRTVDVHIRRLRAKLGIENEHLIGTVRNVGYRFVPGDDNDAEEEDQ